jgi:hypothetical protein
MQPPEPEQVDEGIRLGPTAGLGIAALAIVCWIGGTMIIELTAGIIGRHLGLQTQNFGLALVEFLFSTWLAYLLWLILKHGIPMRAVGLVPAGRSGPDWLLGMLLGAGGVAVALGVVAIGGEVQVVRGPPPAAKDDLMGVYPVAWAILMFVFYAGNEEVLGRGILYPLLRRSMGLVPGLILSSVAFSLMHLTNSHFAMIAALDIFLAGVWLALLRELTGNLYLAWGGHFGWNMALFAAGLPVSGYVFVLHPQSRHVVMLGPSWLTGGSFGPEGGMSGICADLTMIMVALLLIMWRRRKGACGVS